MREEQLAARKEVEREHKNEDEDYTTIDKKFNETHDSLETELIKWNDFKDDKTAIEKHFDSLFKTYSELREYVNDYTFAIPSTFFSLYQQKLDAFIEAYNKQKDLAIPKKKFAFKKKDKNIAKKVADQDLGSIVD